MGDLKSEFDVESVVVGLTILIILYLIPTVVAFFRAHPNRWIIFLVNLVLGGTVIGWIGSLIWAFHAVHIGADPRADGGESGLNLFANDMRRIEIVDGGATNGLAHLEKLKHLLDTGAINQNEFAALKAQCIARLRW